tara:strand:+ start:15 stop:674 length:660 start_codon:yes stop_codon:yes gene_type:complete
MQKALPLKLRPSLKRHDFIIGGSNKEAIRWIDKYPNWKQEGLIIIGPKLSGKSHLVSVLQLKSNMQLKNADDINLEKIDILNLSSLIIENIHSIYNYNFLLHIINRLKENKHKIILTTSVSINKMKIKLPDLKSRLLTLPQTEILLPTDDVLIGIALKLSKDKGLFLSELVLKYIITRVERSYSSINKLISKLDEIALEKKKKITVPFVKEIIDAENLK